MLGTRGGTHTARWQWNGFRRNTTPLVPGLAKSATMAGRNPRSCGMIPMMETIGGKADKCKRVGVGYGDSGEAAAGRWKGRRRR
jgi:hypothetical protein